MLSEIDSLIPMEPKVLPSTRILAFSMQFQNFLVAPVIFIGVQVTKCLGLAIKSARFYFQDIMNWIVHFNNNVGLLILCGCKVF